MTNEPDPIYAAIDRHRLAFNALEADADSKRATIAAEQAAVDVLMDTVPTTRGGCIALLDYLAEIEPTPSPDTWPDGFEVAIRRNLRTALASMAAA